MCADICPVILGIPSLMLDATTKTIIQDLNPAGFILFGRNIESPEQVRNLTAELTELSPLTQALIAVDQEGGRVQRIKWQYPQIPSMRQFGAWYEKEPSLATKAVRLQLFLLGAELADLGFTIDFAPVCDVVTAATHDVIGARAFSDKAEIVSVLAGAGISGLLAGGVWPCLKHAPGHGRAEADSHQSLPVIAADLEALQQDFMPFIVNKSCPFLMTAHIKFTRLDKNLCATDSPTIIQNLMRKKWGYDGIIISDDLGMEALEGTLIERGKRSLAAGCDLAIVSCSNMQNPTEMDVSVWQQVNSLQKLSPLTSTAKARLQACPTLIMPRPHAVEAAQMELQELLTALGADAAA